MGQRAHRNLVRFGTVPELVNTPVNYNDAGIIYQGEQPLFILSAYTDMVPFELSDGTPGHTAAHQLIAQMSRTCYDALRV